MPILALLLVVIIQGCAQGVGNSTASSSPIVINPNNLNFIFVQSFEPNEGNNNLSVTGFNHSLEFGQLLDALTSGSVSAILTLDPWQQLVQGYPNMAPIQSIENYAVLTGSGIFSVLPTTIGSYYNPIYPSIAYYIEEIIGQTAQVPVPKHGNFVIALPREQINLTLAQLSQNPNLYFSFEPIEKNNYHQFIVLSINDVANATATTYNDGIVSSPLYPNLNLNTTASCLESPVSFTLHGAVPPNMNKNETVYLIRHVEAHPVYAFDNGNYVCQGQWRAIGSVDKLQEIMGQLPDQVYSSDPGDPTNSCTIGTPFLPIESCPTYVRPSLTVNPFVIKNKMSLNLVPESSFNWNNYESMATFFFQGGQFNDQTILVSWEHGTIESMVNYLVGTIYGQPQATSLIPVWQGNDYDTVWKLELSRDGQLTFSNTCEGISSASLPLACPLF